MPKYDLSKLVTAMAYSRGTWIYKVEESMVWAIGEYAKMKFAQEVGYLSGIYSWEPEVRRLVGEVDDIILNYRTKTEFDKELAFKEAFRDAYKSCQRKINWARIKMIERNEREYGNILSAIDTDPDWLVDMLNTYSKVIQISGDGITLKLSYQPYR